MNKLLFLVPVLVWAQSGLDRPRAGLMLDGSGAARPVLGLPGSWSAADPVSTGVLSLGCASFCLLKTDAQLIADTATTAPPGPARFALDSSGAFVYFPATRQLARWQSGQLAPIDFQVSGEILSLRSVGGVAEFAVRSAGGVRVVRDGDAVISVLPRPARAVMLLDNGVLFSTPQKIVLLRPDGSEMNFPLAEARSFFRMSVDYVEIFAEKAIFALRVTPGKEQLFQLPEPQQ